MEKAFEHAHFIWPAGLSGEDSYAEFLTSFEAPEEKAVCRISCDGDYTLFLNGEAVGCNQYGDFEYYKIYDDIDLSPYLKKGKNTLGVLVWHFGSPNQRYRPAAPGLIFEVRAGRRILTFSDDSTPARQSRAYASGRKKKITSQLGYSFYYDAGKEDSWLSGKADGFAPAVKVSKNCVFYPRPILRPQNLPRCESRILVAEGNHYLVDLGKETVGLLSLSLISENPQPLTICYGEHLEDGCVRRRVGSRDFSVEYVAAAGENHYTNFMLRLGARYLELFSKEPITLSYLGLCPQVYPIKETGKRPESEEDRRIYELCLRSLRLCMMEHYVDCPWREQCLYAFDSRNQMLAGYDAFKGGNAAYARANLKLLSMDTRSTPLLSICAPCGTDFTIPSFSLHFVLALEEYFAHTGDGDFMNEVYEKVCSVLRFFLENREGDLLRPFADPKVNWNFYDWSECNEGHCLDNPEQHPDAVVNALGILALSAFERICAATGRVFPFPGEAEKIRTAATARFFRPHRSLVTMFGDSEEYTELSNSLAILSGIIPKEARATAAAALAGGKLLPSSLSMKPQTYNALLMADEKTYRPFVLSDIRKNYSKMLKADATATWETIKGASDFDNAGSLCHGWSAIPIHYYHRFGMVR